MDPRKLFHDERLNMSCAYCGGPFSTRDHVPAKVFLDEPYPNSLPVIGSCERCNNGASEDELYVACLLDCVISGTADVDKLKRERIRRALGEQSALQRRLARARIVDPAGRISWKADDARVERILLKLARGHVAYDLSDPKVEPPDSFWKAPMPGMSADERADFEDVPSQSVWPEIGSRAFIRDAVVVAGEPLPHLPWIEVQAGRYRYATSYRDGLTVRILLSEYLACEVVWT